MLIQFRVRNFMSIRDEQIFSLVAASGLKERNQPPADNTVPIYGEEGQVKYELLRAAVLYGANASGKSNLLRAIDFFDDAILLTPPTGRAVGIYFPFVLDKQSAQAPTLCEAIFIHAGITYRYGFEVLDGKVVAEWLYIRAKREYYVFDRQADSIRINREYPKLKELQTNGMIAPAALLVKLGGLFNEKVCLAVQEWAAKLRYLTALEDHNWYDYTVQYLEEPADKKRIIDLLRSADVGIDDVEVTRRETKNYGVTFRLGSEPDATVSERGGFTFDIDTVRNVWDEETGQFTAVRSPLKQFESQGTQKFFNLIGLMLLKLDLGGLLVIDELDTKLHPLLTQRIVQLFNSPITNSRGAQLIFATHDTNLLSATGSTGRLFRRDQIWFTEKDAKGATQLYALTDYKSGKTVRNDEQLEKNYIAGKYGGIPYLGNFDALFEVNTQSEPATYE